MSDPLADRLMDQVAELQERLAQINELLAPSTAMVRAEWRLTPAEQCVFAHLTTRDVCTKQSIMAALYSARAGDEPDIKIVDVLVCKLRKKLKPFGIVIETVWGVGYRLPDRKDFSAAHHSLVWHLGLIADYLAADDTKSAMVIVADLRAKLELVAA